MGRSKEKLGQGSEVRMINCLWRVEGVRVLEASYDEVYTRVKGVLRRVENERKG